MLGIWRYTREPRRRRIHLSSCQTSLNSNIMVWTKMKKKSTNWRDEVLQKHILKWGSKMTLDSPRVQRNVILHLCSISHLTFSGKLVSSPPREELRQRMVVWLANCCIRSGKGPCEVISWSLPHTPARGIVSKPTPRSLKLIRTQGQGHYCLSQSWSKPCRYLV